MQKLFSVRILTLLVLLGLASCEKNTEPLLVAEKEDMTISEAKEWFEGVSKNARTTGEEMYSQVYWKLAFEAKPEKEKKNTVVIVPISHGKKGRAYGYKQLWIYKNKEKKNAMRVVEFVYDKDIPRKDLGKYSFKNFTGAMIVRNWEDDVLGAFRFIDGKKASILQLESITVDGKLVYKKSGKNGRMAGCWYYEGSGWYVTVNGVEIYRYYEQPAGWQCSWEDLYGWDQAPPGDGDSYWSGGGSGGGDPYNITGFSPGQKPLAEYSAQQRCNGLQNMWNAGIQNNSSETYGVITIDGSLLFTQIGGQTGGQIDGIYEQDGSVYYFYPKTGNPTPTYLGTITAHPVYYFVPISATVHTHTPCTNDGTDGISNRAGDDDFPFAARFFQIKHYVIGCSAVAEFNNYSYFNIRNGNLSVTCNNITN